MIHSKTIWPILFLLVSFFGFSQESETELSAETPKYVQANSEFLLIEAQKFFLLEDYKKTLAFLEQALEVDGENHAALFKMAETHLLLEDYDLGQKAIDKAINLRSDNKYYYILAAAIMKAKNAPLQVANYYQLMLDNTEDYSVYSKEVADAFIAVDNIDKAITLYNNTELKSGLTLEQKVGKIDALEKADKTKELESYLKSEVESGTQDNRIVSKYIQLLTENGKALKALSYFDQSPAVTEDQLLLKFELLSTLEMTKEQKELILLAARDEEISIYAKTQLLGSYVVQERSFEELLFADSAQNLINSLHPNDAIAIQGSALLYSTMAKKAPIEQKSDFFKKSIASYKQLVKLDPSDFQAWIKVLSFEREEGLYNDLLNDAEEALDLFPNQALLYIYYAAAYAGQSHYGEAKSLLIQASRMSFGNKTLRSLIYAEEALIAILESDDQMANDLFEKAIALEPAHPNAILSFASFLLKKDPEKSIQTVDPFIKQGSKNKELFRIKTQALFNLSDYSDASRLWDESFEEHMPSLSGPILELKGDILAKLNLTEEALYYWNLAKSSGKTSEKIDQKIANKAY